MFKRWKAEIVLESEREECALKWEKLTQKIDYIKNEIKESDFKWSFKN